MTLEEMVDAIEATSKKNVYLLVEAEINAVARFRLRDTFFKALKQMGEPVESPFNEWEE